MPILALPASKGSSEDIEHGSMEMNVLFELENVVHRGGDRNKAFHSRRQEAMNMQVSWWHQSSTLSQTLSSLPGQLFSWNSYGLNWVK